jgi:hypothetical protein
MITSPSSSARTTAPSEPSPLPRIGIVNTITTTDRSWKMRIPRDIWPVGVSMRARSDSSLRTSAVLLRATR